MWSSRSHSLHPLTALAPNKVKFKSIEVKQKEFDEITCIVTRNNLLVYLDFNKNFDTHLYNINYQLVSVIIQDGKPIAFYSHKRIGPQTRCNVTENEWLNKVKTLKEFLTILLRQYIDIYTDHKNITYKTLTQITCYSGD